LGIKCRAFALKSASTLTKFTTHSRIYSPQPFQITWPAPALTTAGQSHILAFLILSDSGFAALALLPPAAAQANAPALPAAPSKQTQVGLFDITNFANADFQRFSLYRE
jgi:hypothetical protein